MISKVYSLFDSKALYFEAPFFMLNRNMAMRLFADWAQDPKTMIFRHPEDYTLYELGEFDDQTCVIKSGPPESLGNAAQFKAYDVTKATSLVGPLFDSNGKETKVVERAT